jgi:hypothetical protein
MNTRRKSRRKRMELTNTTTPVDRATPVKPARPPRRRMRSEYVVIGSIGALVAGLCLYGVIRDDDRTCINGNYEVIPDEECERGNTGAHWYYGGTNRNGKMSGGSFVRGGFGGHGGGGS